MRAPRRLERVAHGALIPCPVPPLRARAPQPAAPSTAWHEIGKAEMTRSLKDDLNVVAMLGVIDPKRFYKRSDYKKGKLPTHVQVGTVVEGPTEFRSARLKRSERYAPHPDARRRAPRARRARAESLTPRRARPQARDDGGRAHGGCGRARVRQEEVSAGADAEPARRAQREQGQGQGQAAKVGGKPALMSLAGRTPVSVASSRPAKSNASSSARVSVMEFATTAPRHLCT